MILLEFCCMLDSVKSSGQCGKTALAQLSEQFFAELEFVVDVLLVDRQLRLHLDEVFVVVELLRRELSAQEVRDAVAASVDAVLLDKTGTLSEGRHRVEAVLPACGVDE